ncbi:MAG: methionyl-tRNA formyltransferase [Sandaracinus sp.]
MHRARALFFGTPDIAVPSLEALASIADVVRVISQPDRPAGRGNKVQPTPVHAAADRLGLPVMQPVKVRTPELAAELRALEADVAIVIAYGRILPKALLEAPRLGCLNLHASLLPRWRGAAPIQWSIVSGDRETGVCLMQMDEGLDTGPVLARSQRPIGPDETAGELFAALGLDAAELVRTELPRFLRGELTPIPQPSEGVTLARMLEKSDALLDFTQPARAIHDRVRGLTPWPGAETRIAGQRVKVHATRVAEDDGERGAPGTLVAITAEGIEVACGRGLVRLVELQLEGKKRARAADVANGLRLAIGARFGAQGEEA